MIKLQETEKKNLLRIAYWYYKINMTQAEIAQRLGFTRQRVNQIIGNLVDLGVVEIKINGLQDDNVELESALEKTCGLDRVLVFDVDDSENPLDLFGEKAAEALSALLQDTQNIGVSWGVTLGAIVSKMPPQRLPDCTVVQLVGGLNSENILTKSDEITRSLAEKLSCNYHLLYAPAIVQSEQAKKVLLQDNAFAATFERIRNCDVAILGIGELRKGATIHQQGYLSRENLAELVESGYVGDLAMQPFDRDGHWARHNNIIGVDPDTIQKIPNVMAFACGSKKADAVLGAINTKSINTLVIDRSIAEKIAETKGIPLNNRVAETVY